MRLSATAVLVQHLHSGAGPGPAPGLPVLSTIAAYVAVLLGGLLLAPVLTGIGGGRGRRAVVSAVAAAYGVVDLTLVLNGGVGRVAGTVALLAAAAAVVALRRREPADEMLAGATIVGIEAWLVGSGAGVGHLLFSGLHVVAAAIWFGGVAHLALFATSGPERVLLGAGVRRFTRYAVGSGVTLAATGIGLLVIHRVGVTALTTTTFGAVVIGKTALLVLAGLLGLSHGRATSRLELRRRPRLVRTEAGVLSGALGLAVILGGLPAPQALVQLAAPGLAIVNEGHGQQAALFAVRRSVGTAELAVASDESLLVIDRTTGRRYQLAPGGFATVALHGGAAKLRVTSGEQTVDVTVPAGAAADAQTAGAASADTAGWLGYQLGRTVAGGGRWGTGATTPIQLSAAVRSGAGCDVLADAGEADAMATALRSFGVRRLHVIADSSARSKALVVALARHGIAMDRTRRLAGDILLATGSAAADAALRHIAAHDAQSATQPRAIYLAPWLLDGAVLSAVATLRLPPLLVGSPVDPMSPLADAYRQALALHAPGVRPSLAGLLGYASANGVAPPTAWRLYAASPVGFLPGVLDVGHQHADASWFPDGSIVAASAPVATPLICPTGNVRT